MSTSFHFLCVRKFDDGRYEFSACSDLKPRDRRAKYVYGVGPTWWFTPRRADLPESEWAKIKHIIETTSGEWAPSEPNCRSWCFLEHRDGGFVLSPF